MTLADTFVRQSPSRRAAEKRVLVNVTAAALMTAAELAVFVLGMRHPAVPRGPMAITVRVVTSPMPAPAVSGEAMPMIETLKPQATTVPSPPAQPSPPPEAVPMIENPMPVIPPPPSPALQTSPQEAVPIVDTKPPPMPKPLPTPKFEVAEPLPAVPTTKPTPPPRKTRPARPATQDTRPMPAAAASSGSLTQSASLPTQVATGPAVPSNPGGGTMGTRAIFKPMPEIPEELRHHPMTLVAMARFRIASDGTAKVELIKPTANPLVNRTLLATLQRWRFFPAMAQGRPVASTVDIRIPIEVK